MTYQVTSPFWQFVDHWQTLITGVLALVAAFATIWATIASAQREIAANQAQTKVAQDQLATTLRLERRRIVRDGYAFFAMVEAAMVAVLADVEKAREIIGDRPEGGRLSVRAYQARQRVRKAAFEELRNAFLHLGSHLAIQFLELEKAIDDYAMQWTNMPVGDDSARMGIVTGLSDELNVIELKAANLRDEAVEGMKKASAVLAETQDD